AAPAEGLADGGQEYLVGTHAAVLVARLLVEAEERRLLLEDTPDLVAQGVAVPRIAQRDLVRGVPVLVGEMADGLAAVLLDLGNVAAIEGAVDDLELQGVGQGQPVAQLAVGRVRIAADVGLQKLPRIVGQGGVEIVEEARGRRVAAADTQAGDRLAQYLLYPRAGQAELGQVRHPVLVVEVPHAAAVLDLQGLGIEHVLVGGGIPLPAQPLQAMRAVALELRESLLQGALDVGEVDEMLVELSDQLP